MTSLQLMVLSRQDVCRVRLPQIPFKCSVESAEMLSQFKSYHKDAKDCFHVFLSHDLRMGDILTFLIQVRCLCFIKFSLFISFVDSWELKQRCFWTMHVNWKWIFAFLGCGFVQIVRQESSLLGGWTQFCGQSVSRWTARVLN